MANAKDHWEHIYSTRALDKVGWYKPHLTLSVDLIRSTGLGSSSSIIDVGGGASTLVDDLLDAGYTNLKVLDISAAALQASRTRLGDRSMVVQWLVADILTMDLPESEFDLWHDRAVFHFLLDAGDREAYVRRVRRALKPGGHLIMAAFAPDGPERCSGLEVQRYDAGRLLAELGQGFEQMKAHYETHITPGGVEQRFCCAWFRRV